MNCRLCLINITAKGSLALFEISEVNSERLKLIEKCLQLKIIEEDRISTRICLKCGARLDEFNTFCERIKKQQKTLSTLAMSKNKEVSESEEEEDDDDDDDNDPLSSLISSPEQDPLDWQLKCEPEEHCVVDKDPPPIICQPDTAGCGKLKPILPALVPINKKTGPEQQQSSNNDQNTLKRKFSEIEDHKTIEEKLTDIEGILQKQNATFTRQNENIRRALQEQQTMIHRQTELLEIILERFPMSNNLHIFPFKHVREIEEFEKSIKDHDGIELVQYIRNYIGRTGILKCIPLIFAKDCLLEVSWDGKFNKISMKDTILFSKLLYDAVKTENYNYNQYVKDVKRGFRTAKNTQYRAKHRLNYSQKKTENGMLI